MKGSFDLQYCLAVVVSSFFNSRQAIAAIIGDIVVFFNSKILNCIGALCFFFKMCSHVFQ